MNIEVIYIHIFYLFLSLSHTHIYIYIFFFFVFIKTINLYYNILIHQLIMNIDFF